MVLVRILGREAGRLPPLCKRSSVRSERPSRRHADRERHRCRIDLARALTHITEGADHSARAPPARFTRGTGGLRFGSYCERLFARPTDAAVFAADDAGAGYIPTMGAWPEGRAADF